MEFPVVCVVGPSGSIKSTVGYILAAKLNYRFLDAGLIWRCLGAKLLHDYGGETDDTSCLAVADSMLECARCLHLPNDRPAEDIAELLTKSMGVAGGMLTEHGVAELTSMSTRHVGVRRVIAEVIRTLAWTGGNVAVGRPYVYREVFTEAFLRVLIYTDAETQLAVNRDGETAAQIAARNQRDGVDDISTAVGEIAAMFNMKLWHPIKLAQTLWLLAWQQSPYPIAANPPPSFTAP